MNVAKSVKPRPNAIFTRIGNWFDRVKTTYANLKIHQKLFGLQYLVVLLFGTVCLAGIKIALNLYDDIIYSESAKTLNLSTINIENELKQIEKVSMALLSHPDIQRDLHQLESPLPEAQSKRLGNQLTEILWNYLFERNITSVHLLDLQGRQYSGGAALPASLVKALLAKAIAGNGAPVLIEPLPGEQALILVRQVREISNLSLRPLGILVIRINTVAMIQQSTATDVKLKGNLLIYNGTKKIYASSDLGQQLGDSLVFRNDSGYRMARLKNHRYFVAHTHSVDSGWLYVNIIPYDNIFRPIILLRLIVALIFILFLVGTIFFSNKIARSITKPIENLTAQMKRVENGDFSLEPATLSAVGRADEIGDLQRDFTIMIQKINTLIQEDYTKQIVIKDTQFRALQAQINPHFLYNTMESINWLAKINGQQEISRMVEALGNLLRCAMNQHDSLITLGREQELLRDYIAIQQVRFGERLQFEMIVEPQWLHLAIPKLTLQPLVENSIRYGLEAVTGVCRISITAFLENGALVVAVADNGPGFTPEILQKMARHELQSGGKGIGLQNIHERLRLMFGESCGLELANLPEGGALVRMRIPGKEAAANG